MHDTDADTTQAAEWPPFGDPDAHVGTRHHLLPRFYLQRFARDDRVAVVDPRTKARRVAPIKDTAAERDFYTFVNTEGNLDGRMEQLLGQIEGDAASAIRSMTSIFGGDVAVDKRASVCLLMAFQRNRGRSARRRVELFADLTTRLLADGIRDRAEAQAFLERQGTDPTDANMQAVIDTSARLDDLEFATDPNAHLGMIGQIAQDSLPYLLSRPWFIVEYTSPALLTSDEPVSLYTPGPHSADEALGLANARQIYFPWIRFGYSSSVHSNVGRAPSPESPAHLDALPQPTG